MLLQPKNETLEEQTKNQHFLDNFGLELEDVFLFSLVFSVWGLKNQTLKFFWVSGGILKKTTHM